MSVVSATTVLFVLSGRSTIAVRREAWLKPFMYFLAVGAISIAFSPYIAESAQKGLIQITGMFAACVFAFAVTSAIYDQPSFLLTIVRTVVLTYALLALVGLAQFLDNNVFGGSGLFDFSYMNTFAGGDVWNYPGEIGGLTRVNSISTEPAHFTRFLGVACGFALVRLGIAGAQFRSAAARFVPLWCATAIVLGYLISLSILGYVHLVAVGLACIYLPLTKRKKVHFIAGTVIALTIGLGALNIAKHFSDSEFLSKVATIESILDPFSTGDNVFLTEQVSALAVRINVEVTKTNLADRPLIGVGLGAHAQSYQAKAPELLFSVLDGLNADDAASLLLRLLSETGIAGTLAFLIGAIGLLTRARTSILLTLSTPMSDSQSRSINVWTSISIAVTASWAGMLLISLIRTGFYYDAGFWLLVGLTAAVPKIQSLAAEHHGVKITQKA